MAARNKSKNNIFIYYIYSIVVFLTRFGASLFACRSFTKSQFVYKLYVGLWIIHVIIALLYVLLYYIHQGTLTMSRLLFFMIYASEMLAYFVILLESFVMNSKRKITTKMFVEFDKRFVKEFGITHNNRHSNQGCILTILSFITTIATTVHVILTWMKYKGPLVENVLYWQNFPSCLAMQFLILELISAITVLNEYAMILRIKINELGERNIQRVFWPHLRGRTFSKADGIVRVMPKPNESSEEDDERKLRTCKKLYDDIHNMLRNINDSYGWSVLAFMIMYFIYLVIYSYGTIFALITQQSSVRDFEFLVIAVFIVYILCWKSQISHDESHEIGCIMFKLVRPFGTKRYDNFITNFSLQTLHQQYIITAKGFFNVNLNLLGNMIASIVTYMVILMQVMYAENEKVKRNQRQISFVTIGNSTSD